MIALWGRATRSMGDLQEKRWRIGDVVFDPGDGVLRRDGRRIALKPKVIGILSVLVEAAPRTVTKEQILDSVWPETVVSEAALTQRVCELRQALGDDARSPRYLATVARRGYRLVAAVERLEGEHGDGPEASVEILIESSPAPGAPTATRPRRWWSWAGIALAAAATFVWMVVDGPGRRGLVPAAAAPTVQPTFTPRPGVAVLDLVDSSGSPGSEWVGTALTEMLLTELGAGGTLRTVAPDVTTRGLHELGLRPAPLTPEDLVRLRGLLAVDLLLTGRYRLSDTGGPPALVVDLELRRTASGTVLATFGEIGSPDTLAELAGRVGCELRRAAGAPELSALDAEVLRRNHPRGGEAARRYAEGLAMLRAFEFPASVAAFQDALEIDPDSVPLRAALAQALAWSGRRNEARVEIAKALEAATAQPREMQLQIEATACEMTGDWKRALEIGRSLHVLRPDEVDVGLSLASLLAAHGHVEGAERVLSELRRLPEPFGLDPRIDLAEAWMRESDLTGKLAAAGRAAERARELGAPLLLASARIQQGRAFRGLGKPDEALEAFTDAVHLRQSAGDTSAVGRALRHVAGVERDRGELSAARDHLGTAVEIADELGEIDQQVAARRDLAALALDRGALGEAAHYIADGWAVAGDRIIPEESSWLSVEAARLALMARPPAQAVSAARAAAQRCRSERLSNAEARSRALLARALAASGDTEAAASESRAAARLATATDDRGVRLEVATAAAVVAAISGDGCASASPALESALADAPSATLSLRLEAGAALAECTRAGGDEATARALLLGVEEEARRHGLGVPAQTTSRGRPSAADTTG